jgi:hypothetical protein
VFEFWGAQLEQRSSVTAYTVTTTQPITNYIPALQSAASGVARFEHNPVTGESLGLEIEKQRTNLNNYSEQFDNAYWIKNGTTVSANATIAPDGTLTAEKLIGTATTAIHLLQLSSVTGSGSHTMSVHAKAGEYTRFAIRESNVTGHGALFDLSAGTVITTASATATITPVGNGWYRCTATITWGSGYALGITLSTNTNTSSLLETFTGNGFSGIYIWGAQLEAGSFATSYIPTVDSQVTRSADSASMTGTNFSSWYRADEGSVYAEVATKQSTFSVTNDRATVFAISKQGSNLNMYEAFFFNGLCFHSRDNGTFSSGSPVVGSSTVANQYYKVAINYSGQQSSLASLDGAISSALARPFAKDTMGRMYLGNSLSSSGRYLDGYIKKIAFYPKALTSAELQGVTTV